MVRSRRCLAIDIAPRNENKDFSNFVKIIISERAQLLQTRRLANLTGDVDVGLMLIAISRTYSLFRSSKIWIKNQKIDEDCQKMFKGST